MIKLYRLHERVGMRRLLLTGLAIISLAMFIGCASLPRFASSTAISRQFERGQVMTGHRYYVGGPQAKPNAIVAIAPSYTLQSDHWRPVTVTSDELKRLVYTVGFVVQAQYQSALRPNGARILAPDGTVVGAWYSVYDYSRVELMNEKTVFISAPLANLPNNVPRPL